MRKRSLNWPNFFSLGFVSLRPTGTWAFSLCAQQTFCLLNYVQSRMFSLLHGFSGVQLRWAYRLKSMFQLEPARHFSPALRPKLHLRFRLGRI